MKIMIRFFGFILIAGALLFVFLERDFEIVSRYIAVMMIGFALIKAPLKDSFVNDLFRWLVTLSGSLLFAKSNNLNSGSETFDLFYLLIGIFVYIFGLFLIGVDISTDENHFMD